MILRTIVIFALVLASVYVGAHLQQDPGYMLIVMHHWTIETTLWVAIPGLILMILILHLSILICLKIIRIPTAWHQWRTARRAQQAQAKTRQGLIEFNEGYWQLAKKHLIKALPDTDTPLLNYLTAARAAEEMGDHTLRDDYLRQAQQSMPEAKIAVELTQAQLQLANQQWEQALATLKHLQDLEPHHPYVLKLLMQLYEEIKDWPQLIALLPTLRRHQVLSNSAFIETQRNAYLNELLDLIKQDSETKLTQFIQSLPKELRLDHDIVAAYARYLLAHHQDKQVESILYRCLQKQISEQCIDLYGQIAPDVVQIGFIESLLKTQPHSAALNLCLGRIGASKQLWGKARSYFEESIKLNPTPEAYAELGKLFEQLHNTTAACKAYHDGLLIILGD
ncbi:MAG: heme biosynthesis HemY N-terminal domain-containing protein [Legionellaceae bacterium]|nr:heme biosynthesis HemY N-terminal domain-containing protein [Legionellaceae bacterium]